MGLKHLFQFTELRTLLSHLKKIFKGYVVAEQKEGDNVVGTKVLFEIKVDNQYNGFGDYKKVR